jgi:SAM-dependent methyltransferase
LTFADHFSGASAAYAAFRPRYPDALFDFLARVAPARDAAWDVGTGTGQAAVGLARHFAHVVASDASRTQIEHATPNARVSYRVAPAEASGLDSASVDLVTVAQALHWFDRSRFMRDFYSGIVGPFWPPERRITEERYQTIEFPFTEIVAPSFVIEQTVTLDDAAGYVRTWSATRAFLKHHRRDPVDDLVKQLARAWGAPQESRLARWPVSMRVGRVA